MFCDDPSDFRGAVGTVTVAGPTNTLLSGYEAGHDIVVQTEGELVPGSEIALARGCLLEMMTDVVDASASVTPSFLLPAGGDVEICWRSRGRENGTRTPAPWITIGNATLVGPTRVGDEWRNPTFSIEAGDSFELFIDGVDLVEMDKVELARGSEMTACLSPWRRVPLDKTADGVVWRTAVLPQDGTWAVCWQRTGPTPVLAGTFLVTAAAVQLAQTVVTLRVEEEYDLEVPLFSTTRICLKSSDHAYWISGLGDTHLTLISCPLKSHLTLFRLRAPGLRI